jgi:thiosulfate dehydrogenase
MITRHATHRLGKLRKIAALLGSCLLSACSEAPEQSAARQGRQLFESKALSQSRLNDYTCLTCHDTVASSEPSKQSGGALAGVTLRTRFWGGQEPDLLGSINACRNYFMGDNLPLAASDERARSLYAYLASLEPGDANPIPFTVVTSIEPLARGNEARGQVLYAQACLHCHGNTHDGLGRLSERLPVLPEDTLADPDHAEYSPRLLRLVFTEKIRHGLFLGYGGVMPPFSAEVLSDEEVSDVLEALGVLGE